MKKRHILVVDDDPFNASALRMHFKGLGFRVTLADTCAEGQRALAGKDPVDVVILDHLLPDGTGTDFLDTIGRGERFQKPPVIISSSIVDPRNPNWTALLERLPIRSQALVQAYVPKPYSFDNMDTVVDLVFESNPIKRSRSKTFLAGDYRHPKKS